MRRHEFEQFMRNTCIGLLNDCAFYCWQNHQITDKEYHILEVYCTEIYKKNNGGIYE